MLDREQWLRRIVADKFKKQPRKTTTPVTEYKPENIDPQRIVDFLGNWRYLQGILGWEFVFPQNPEETAEVLLEISRRFVRISTPSMDNTIHMSIARPDVEKIEILAENQLSRLDEIDNPRLGGIFTRTGFLLLYRNDLEVVETVDSKKKPNFTTSSFPFGTIATLNKLLRKSN